MTRAYYALTKPGIVYGNALPLVASFVFAARGQFPWITFIAVLGGQSLIIASACVVNNFMDRSIDEKMNRTKGRASVTGTIGPRAGLTYAAILGGAGALSLIVGTNGLTFLVGATGFVVYVVLYGYAKRRGPYGTLVGSIAGAMPPVAGYTAVTGRLDLTAFVLFTILVCWQMPHFYAIAIYRQDDYRTAGVPVLPVARSLRRTKFEIIAYTIAFVGAASALGLSGKAGIIYLVGVALASGLWLGAGLRGFKTVDSVVWARRMFFLSLIVLIIWCASLALDSYAYYPL